ncbi:hypothetical protein [Roseixanthobacter liquoris]|uniref:hypothetical protein n=1 Tax=Roseixanthobacter liquoris TaxID=3119921 RepID=UPI003729369A
MKRGATIRFDCLAGAHAGRCIVGLAIATCEPNLIHKKAAFVSSSQLTADENRFYQTARRPSSQTAANAVLQKFRVKYVDPSVGLGVLAPIFRFSYQIVICRDKAMLQQQSSKIAGSRSIIV